MGTGLADLRLFSKHRCMKPSGRLLGLQFVLAKEQKSLFLTQEAEERRTGLEFALRKDNETLGRGQRMLATAGGSAKVSLLRVTGARLQLEMAPGASTVPSGGQALIFSGRH